MNNEDYYIILICILIMKIPLRFQITEFDCGTISLQNAISYLFEREDIPAELIRAIALYTLDCYDEKWNLGQWWTSRESIALVTKWITTYAKTHDFGISAIHKEWKEVTVSLISSFLNSKSVVLLRTYLEDVEHYVIITGIDSDFVYIWDPYYLEKSYYNDNKKIEIILHHLFDYNRKVSLKWFDSNQKKDFSLWPLKYRECVLIKRK